MSAQAGVWYFDGMPVGENLLDSLNKALSQHGPDGSSRRLLGALAMLYRPFHTTSESRRERQPHISRCGNVFTWDGRLDNREELLALLGDHASGNTDVELAAAAYDTWGADCFSKLLGDWATSVWDPSHKILVLAKDHVGCRHLYYYLTGARVIWSTKIDALLLGSGDQFKVDDHYIAGFLAFYPEEHRTPFQDIHNVPPASFVTIRNGHASTQRYWRLESKNRLCYRRDTEYEEHFRQMFRQAVRRRLRSDVPMLAELSGGLDSSSIVCMADDIAASESVQVPQLQTISYYDVTEPSGDDLHFLTIVERRRGMKGFHIDASTDAGNHFSSERPYFAPFPELTQNVTDTELATLMKRNQFRAVLSGIGGDEFLGGVPDPRAQLADFIVTFRLRRLAKQLMVWSLVKKRPWIQLLVQAVSTIAPLWLREATMTEAKVPAWINSDFARRHRLGRQQLGCLETSGFWLPSRRDFVRTFRGISMQMASTPPSILCCEERRYPYLDRELVEFLASIPAEQLLRPGERRSLMRRALAHLVPKEILERKTKQVSVRRYMVALDSHWRDIETLLSSSLVAEREVADSRLLWQALHAARNGHAPQLIRLLRILAVELWLRDMRDRRIVRDTDMTPLHAATLGLKAVA